MTPDPRGVAPSGEGAAPLALFLGLGAATLLWWGFAFFPLSPEASPALKIAREVCFGLGDSGLPHSGGWLLLIGAPLSFLAVGLTAWGGQWREAKRLALHSPFWFALSALLAGTTLWEAGFVANRIRAARLAEEFSFGRESTAPMPETYPRSRKPLPAFSLLDQSGSKVGPASLKGRVTVVAFIYSHCRTICPLLIKDSLAGIQLMPQGTAQAVFITLDPWRDTPSSLPGLARSLGLPGEARVLSGSVAEVNHLLDELAVRRGKDERTGELIHPPTVLMLDKEARVAYEFNSPSPAWLQDAAARLSKP